MCLRGVYRQNRAQWHGPSYSGDQDKKPPEPRGLGKIVKLNFKQVYGAHEDQGRDIVVKAKLL